MPFDNEFNQNFGSYVPTTNIWDISELYNVDINSPEFKELLVRLYQYINNIALVLNTKNSALYFEQEFQTGAVFAKPPTAELNDTRGQFRRFYMLGSLGAGANTFPHGLTVTNTWTWTYIGGTATNTGTPVGYPIPFAGSAGNNIEIYVDGTNININNGSGVTFTNTDIILEYLKY